MMKYWSFASEPIDSVMETLKRWTVTSVTDDDPWMPRLAPSLSARSPAIFALLLSSHSVPCRREVKVQLLDPGPLQSSSQDAVCVAGVQMEERLSSGCLGNNTNTTAAHQIKVEFSSLRQTAVLVTAVLTSVLVMQYFVCRGRSVCIAVLQTLCLCVSVWCGGSSVSAGWWCTETAAGSQVHTHTHTHTHVCTAIFMGPLHWLPFICTA